MKRTMQDHEDAEGVEFGVFWGNSLRARVVPKVPIIDNFIYRNDVVCISADAGVGKSLIALQLMCNLTTGEPFLGTYKVMRPCNVCLLQTEGDRAETLDRLNAMTAGVHLDDSKWVHINLGGIALNTYEGMQQFKELALAPKMQYDVIIIDPLYTTVKGDISKNEVATDWIRNLREIKKTFKNCAVIILHHVPKDHYVDGVLMPKTMFGSAFWKAYVNYNYTLTRHDGKHVLGVEKKRNDKIGFDKLELKLVEPHPLMFVYADHDPSLARIKIMHTIENSPHPVSAKKVMELTEVSKATTFRVLKLVMHQRKIKKTSDENDNHLYEACEDDDT